MPTASAKKTLRALLKSGRQKINTKQEKNYPMALKVRPNGDWFLAEAIEDRIRNARDH
jgi:hypothetical protein